MRKTVPVVAAFLLIGTALLAQAPFEPLMEVARATWPEKTRIGVVADYQASAGEVEALAQAVGAGYTVIVLDVRSRIKPVDAPRLLAARVKPDYVVLLREDPVFRDGTLESTWLVKRAALAGIPAIGTTPAAVSQGAVFAVGPATGNQLLVNPGLKGSIHVVMPERQPLRVSALRPDLAEVVLVRF